MTLILQDLVEEFVSESDFLYDLGISETEYQSYLNLTAEELTEIVNGNGLLSNPGQNNYLNSVESLITDYDFGDLGTLHTGLNEIITSAGDEYTDPNCIFPIELAAQIGIHSSEFWTDVYNNDPIIYSRRGARWKGPRISGATVMADVAGGIDGALFGSVGGPLGAVLVGFSGAVIGSSMSIILSSFKLW